MAPKFTSTTDAASRGGSGLSEEFGCNAPAVTRERPILFSAPMVRALLDDTKTQTRRAWPIQPPPGVPIGWVPGETSAGRYGKRGDRLWVREAFRFLEVHDHVPPRELSSGPLRYAAGPLNEAGPHDGHLFGKLRPGMFMPRWASRITLEVTDVRVERLNSISRGDAMAEGCPFQNMAQGPDPRQWYADLWDQINGAGAWAANPWVWVVEFRRCGNLQPNVPVEPDPTARVET
jgi:hypothetical protein